jgi:hypothetical protein
LFISATLSEKSQIPRLHRSPKFYKGWPNPTFP